MRVLVVNAGSSSLKLRLLGPGDELEAEHDLAPDDGDALVAALADMPAPDAVGHRVVHGGERFRDAVLVDDERRGGLGELTELAPLHQPAALAGIAAVGALPCPTCPRSPASTRRSTPRCRRRRRPTRCPREWRERFGLRRFGFHGLSHAYASRRAAAPRGS